MYEKIDFKDRRVEFPRRYTMVENEDGTITLQDAFGANLQEGTPLNALNMNRLDDGIAACGLTKYFSTTTYNKNELVVDSSTGKIYVSQSDNNKGTDLADTTYWKLLVIGTLETARKINNTDFDGSADITTAIWGTARNISISSNDGTGSGTPSSVNGSSPVTLKLPSTIKANLEGDVTGNLTGNVTGNASTSTRATRDANGNVITSTYATKAELDTARPIIEYY